MFAITPSARLRPSPYFDATLAEGVTAFTTYNRMLMPTSHGDPEGEYWRLINGVSQWDVAVERPVQLCGPDAGRLAQILSPRDLSRCTVGQGKYVPLCNHQGVLINDPIVLKLAEDLYWLSIADSNIWFWAAAIAAERGLDVEISEPDVSPMAVQGPLAEAVVAHLCSDWVRGRKYFWFREAMIDGIPVIVARSGRVEAGRVRTLSARRHPGQPAVGAGARGRQGLGHRAGQPQPVRARREWPHFLWRRQRHTDQPVRGAHGQIPRPRRRR